MQTPQVHRGHTWHWDKARRPEHFRRCGYCGCIHPDDLIAEASWAAEWADQKYGWPHKFYVTIADRKGELDYLGSSTSDMGDEELARYGWKRVEDLTPEELAVAQPHLDDFDGRVKVIGIGPRKTHHAKFYSEHLADPNISQDAKDTIARTSGLVFEWLDGGRVSWRPYVNA